jgi:hypothetical protein
VAPGVDRAHPAARGQRRERDVTIAALREFSAAVGTADRPGIESLIAQVRAEQAEANLALAPHVSAERIAALVGRLEALVAALDPGAVVPTPVAALGEGGTEPADREVVGALSANGGGAR